MTARGTTHLNIGNDMTQFLSKHAARRLTPPVPYQAGMEAVAVFEYTLNDDYVAANDIIEIGSIPATARLTGATLIGAGFTASTTADVGLMDGDAGEKDTSRDLTTDLLFDGADVVDNEVDATLADCLAIEASNAHRGIGVTLSADETASASKTLTLLIRYTY